MQRTHRILWGEGMFLRPQHFQRHPDESARFDAAMLAKSHAEIAAVGPVMPLQGVNLLADVGGGRGHFLLDLLDRHPGLQGLLVDQPHVVFEPRYETSR